MYIREAVEYLEKTLRAVSGPATTVYIAHGRNCFAEDDFLALCKPHWAVEVLAADELHAKFRDESVSVWRLKLCKQ